MSNYNSLKTTINANVKQNGVQAITGQILNAVLNAMVNTLGAGYQFAGVATTATNPGSPDAKVFYIANGKGTYTNFGGISVTEDDVVVLYWDSSWHKVSTGIASQEKLSELDSQINGENIEEEIEQIAEVIVPNARILSQTSVVDYLPLATSSSLYLYFFPIINGGKYRFIIRNIVASTAYWGYANEVVESISGDVNLQGKLIEMTIPSAENPIFEKTIESAEDFRYIAICGIGGTGHFYKIDAHREGGVIEKLDSIENDLTDIKEKVIGEPVEVEQDVSSIKDILSARIEATGIQQDSIRFNTSSNTRLLKFYPIERGKKYKIYSSYISNSTAYWGYANEIPDSITERVTCDGMCPFEPVPTASQNIEYVIDAAEDYGYIAISAPTSAFDSGTAKLCEIVERYVGGVDDIKRSVELNTERIEELERKENESLPLGIASGNLDESCLVENQTDYYVGYHSVNGGRKTPDANEDIVVIAHDDLPEVDYIATRKIYNKYNFSVTFNYILHPFTSLLQKDAEIKNIKKMIAEGHEIGFHACLGSSFFWRNPMFDVTPSGGATFAPTLSELKTDIGGGNNIFGKSVASATFSTMGYSGDPATKSVLLADATSAQWLDAHRFYAIYGTQKNVTGLDLDDNNVTKTYLEWLEYWYNELIDDTLGYSKYDGTIAERFAEDYVGNYPDSEHIINGELSSYGHFTKGLFKGCHSCCNYEVIDRILLIAEAYTRKFFGLTKFTNAAYHGVEYINLFWTGENGALYNNRETSVLATGYTRLYVSSRGKTMNLFDILLAHGICINKRLYPSDPTRVIGQIGFYKGQKEIRGAVFNDMARYHTNTDQVAIISKSASSVSDNITKSELLSWMPAKYEDWLKFAYENAGEAISDGRGTMYVRDYIKQTIDVINSARGTGKIAFLGVDTIKLNASVMAAVELICQYCYRHNIRMVTSTEGMILCNNDRNMGGNLFPNPSFRQSLLEDFGGNSTSKSAYIPDGWFSVYNNYSIGVSKIDGNRVLTLGGDSAFSLTTRLYGLTGGKYRFSAKIKTTDVDPTCMIIRKGVNGDRADSTATTIAYINATNEYTDVTRDFTIPTPHKNALDGTLENTLCNGYEDNVAFIEILLRVEAGKETSLYDPRIVAIP